jgi:hypothetical protein
MANQDQAPEVNLILLKCNTQILLQIWLYKNLLETILLLKEYKVVLFIIRHLKLF